MTISHVSGHVIADARSFPGGDFHPINTAHGIFHPDAVSGDGELDAVLPPLRQGEFYQVREEIDKSEGRLGTTEGGNFLSYLDAYAASAGKGVQGGIAKIEIASPYESSGVTALDSNGNEIPMATVIVFRAVQLAERMVFSQPWATNTSAE